MLLQVEQVLFSKGALVSHGTLHLTAHHIIFRYDEPVSDETEMWVSDLVVICCNAFKNSSPLDRCHIH